MKKTISILLTVLLLVGVACTKKNPVSGETDLLGTWRFIEYYYSIGGPGQWQQADPPGQTITFSANGSFLHSGEVFNTFNSFEIIDSITVRISPSTAPNGYNEFHYEIDATGDALTLSPSNPACIEGCAYRFQRVFIR